MLGGLRVAMIAVDQKPFHSSEEIERLGFFRDVMMHIMHGTGGSIRVNQITLSESHILTFIPLIEERALDPKLR